MLLNQENLYKKRLIGKRAAEIVETGDTIILDSGSTTTEIAKNLIGRKQLFLATAGISLRSGLTYPSLCNIGVKKAQILRDNDIEFIIAE